MPGTSKFYVDDPNDPEAPVSIDLHCTPGGDIRPGSHVLYVNPGVPPLPGTLVVTELVQWWDEDVSIVQAVLNDGEWEVNADNLRPVATR